ncbi:MAG: carbamoyltransferase HypF [Alphaproteobacteria bacterium]
MSLRADTVIATPEAAVRRRIVVRGAVQGVGFRPFVYRQATALGLAGSVANTAVGVVIEAEGSATSIAALVRAIQAAPPAHAQVIAVDEQSVTVRGDSCFEVRTSDAAGRRATQLLPDLATCPACLAELLDPTDRRHRHPFISCTDCGPRYSIVEDVPYDRSRTAMRHFAMCLTCRREYEDPANRRFHAETIACPKCGPQLALWDRAAKVIAVRDEALRAAAMAIREGGIVAVKGIGGFHLMADARNEVAVRRLRAGKRRDDKPFAVMFASVAAVRAACRVDPEEAELLGATERPIVLLGRESGAVATAVAPGSPRLGAMLPYSPFHHLLLHDLGFPVVATSGNISDEPIVVDEREALDRLAGVADLFLVHDRPILRPLDDSVAHVVCGAPQVLRRARGYAPAPVTGAGLLPGIIAYGAHLKATVAVTGAGSATLSQHLGDLETVAARDVYRRAIDDLGQLHEASAQVSACDLHPDYASSRLAQQRGLRLAPVQHHVAHVAACLAEHDIAPPALGVAWDGTGYGPDGTIWGGEFIELRRGRWRRAAHLRRFSLPGGDAAAREPRRAALGMLYAAYGGAAFAMDDLAPVASFTGTELELLRRALARGINAPLASSMGRLFDAFAALCGLHQRTTYEGQAAMALEAAAEGAVPSRAYDLPLRAAADGGLEVDWWPALAAALDDLRGGAGPGAISAALHQGLVAAIVAVAAHVGEPRVALTGGCFQNRRLTESAFAALRQAGFEPLWHRRVPPNDGGIALGQAAWTSWTLQEEAPPCV